MKLFEPRTKAAESILSSIDKAIDSELKNTSPDYNKLEELDSKAQKVVRRVNETISSYNVDEFAEDTLADTKKAGRLKNLRTIMDFGK